MRMHHSGKKKNHITSISNETNQLFMEEDDIANAFYSHFLQLFTSSLLSCNDIEECTQTIEPRVKVMMNVAIYHQEL